MAGCRYRSCRGSNTGFSVILIMGFGLGSFESGHVWGRQVGSFSQRNTHRRDTQHHTFDALIYNPYDEDANPTPAPKIDIGSPMLAMTQ